MTFFRLLSKNCFNYNINGVPLPRIADVIKYLGIHFESKLTLNTHFHCIKVKAFKLFEFIYRSCVGFNDKNTFISIYCSLVHSIILE
ncbi:Reverse transcriptase domain-containing protein [Aphis craccivora]|uniref:Reverse transcriptase domain-containing protein n=1 Tax=Aphis craccivora TaxID=307492 RepID=A0A6G0ZRA6_APHCR|nr:Reverse transcriptase domain-containing protein [Aphis craccivora]